MDSNSQQDIISEQNQEEQSDSTQVPQQEAENQAGNEVVDPMEAMKATLEEKEKIILYQLEMIKTQQQQITNLESEVVKERGIVEEKQNIINDKEAEITKIKADLAKEKKVGDNIKKKIQDFMNQPGFKHIDSINQYIKQLKKEKEDLSLSEKTSSRKCEEMAKEIIQLNKKLDAEKDRSEQFRKKIVSFKKTFDESKLLEAAQKELERVIEKKDKELEERTSLERKLEQDIFDLKDKLRSSLFDNVLLEKQVFIFDIFFDHFLNTHFHNFC